MYTIFHMFAINIYTNNPDSEWFSLFPLTSLLLNNKYFYVDFWWNEWKKLCARREYIKSMEECFFCHHMRTINEYKKKILYYFSYSILTVKFGVTDFAFVHFVCLFCSQRCLLLLRISFSFCCVRHMHDIFTNRLFFSAFSTLSCLCYIFASTVKRITSFFTRDMSHALVYVCIYVFFSSFGSRIYILSYKCKRLWHKCFLLYFVHSY